MTAAINLCEVIRCRRSAAKLARRQSASGSGVFENRKIGRRDRNGKRRSIRRCSSPVHGDVPSCARMAEGLRAAPPKDRIGPHGVERCAFAGEIAEASSLLRCPFLHLLEDPHAVADEPARDQIEALAVPAPHDAPG